MSDAESDPTDTDIATDPVATDPDDAPTVALVLAGGTGSRLYPASRSDRPKQFLPLLGEASLLERTVDRAGFADRVVVSTRPALESGVRERVGDAVDDVVVEPAGKDTGPALAYATHRVADRYGADAVVVTLPSDHHVGDVDAFRETMRAGVDVARGGRLVAFGVVPSRVETGYGYIEPGPDHGGWAELAAFHEKPDRDTAERYVAAGYRWNAGVFAWTARAFLAAARDSPLAPLVEALDAGDAEAGFEAVDPVSVDYAVMERVDDAAVVPLDVAWDDLGSWDALARLLESDAEGNVVAGAGEALFVDSHSSVVASDGPHVSVVGLDDVAVVAWGNRVLVVPESRAQAVREVVSILEDEGRF